MPDTRDDEVLREPSGPIAPVEPVEPGPGKKVASGNDGGIPRDTLLGGRYRVERLLGKGGMGRVYAALDERLGRRVAVKVLSNRVGDETAEMLERESRILAGLRHPGIVALHEAVSEADCSYLVMDLVDGVALGDGLERVREALAASGVVGARPQRGEALESAIGRPLPPGRESLIAPGDWFRTVARIELEIVRTIEAAHGGGVVHRDLKPQNVMLTGGGAPVILDFGLGGRFDGDIGTITRGLYGTIAYLAPEQIERERVGTDPRTDVYQLGLILYEMLTLRRAFAGDTMGDLLVRIQRGLFPRPRSLDKRVPRDLEAICLKACELDPAHRYVSARALSEDLERYLEGRAVSCGDRWSRARASMRRARRTMAAHPVITGGALVAATAIIAASAASWGTPAELAGFRMHGNGIIDKFEIGDYVEPGDYLGVDVRTRRPQYLYAFSIFQDEDKVRHYVPMKPALLDQRVAARGGFPPEPENWGLEVPPCSGKDECPKIFCTQIEVGDKANPVEGLHVFCSLVPRPDLENWLADVHEKGGKDGLTAEDTFALLPHPLVTRGTGVRAGMSAEIYERQFAPLLDPRARKKSISTIDEQTKSLFVEGRVATQR